MKVLWIGSILAGALMLVACSKQETCDFLFVQSSKGMAFDGTRLTLKEANPNIIFFCDRPVRVAGHLSRSAFMKLVTEGEDSFAKNHPNAAVSIFGENNEVTESVVELSARPVSSGDDLIYLVKVLEGVLPPEGGAVAMFIDPIGRPLSPGSVAGVHRRHRRRAVRHVRH